MVAGSARRKISPPGTSTRPRGFVSSWIALSVASSSAGIAPAGRAATRVGLMMPCTNSRLRVAPSGAGNDSLMSVPRGSVSGTAVTGTNEI
jgi:hypothetical protein